MAPPTPLRSRPPHSRAILVAVALVCGSALPLTAQGPPQRVEGRVSGEDGSLIVMAEVTAIRAPDRLARVAHTDSAGRYSITFEQGTGDYLVHVRAMGWKPIRQRVTRPEAGGTVALDIKLAPEAVQVEGVVTRAARQAPERSIDMGPGTGASERVVDGVAAAVPPDQAGDLGQIASLVPGILSTSQGLVTLGVSGQSNATLNGMAFSGTVVPRDTRTRTRVTTSTYDPARGGFGGARTEVELAPGGTFTFRRAHLTFDHPALQVGDALSARLGQEYSNVQGSAGADGELVRDRVYYNVGVQAEQRAADAVSLANAGSDALRAFGVSPDSASLLLDLLARSGGLSTAGASTRVLHRNFTVLGRLDRTPRAPRTWSLTAYGRAARADMPGASPLAASVWGGERTTAVAQVQGSHSVRFGRHFLNDTHSAVSYTSDRTGGGVRAARGRVLVAGGEPARDDGLVFLAFGGSGGTAARTRALNWESINETRWNSAANRHAVKLHMQSRFDRFSRDGDGDDPGTFTFASLADLQANRPVAYSRDIGPRSASMTAWDGALALGDQWKITPKFQVLYGARVEGGRFLSRPDHNPALARAFGVRNDRTPGEVHLSPRAGFTWVYGGGRAAFRSTTSSLGTRITGPQGVIRGGVGEFRNRIAPALAADAFQATGLPGSAHRILCVGDAAPLPAWNAYAGHDGAPLACAGHPAGGGLADAAPDVELFSPSFSAPRSWRANLAWNSVWRKVGVAVEGIYALNVRQPGAVDLNFAGVPRFTLAGEGARPVFVTPSSIVEGSGTVSPVAARRVQEFARVMEARSDLRSTARQVTVTLTPELAVRKYFASGSYTLSDVRSLERGFDGATFGDPRSSAWGTGDFDLRHRIIVQGGVALRDKFTFTLMGRFSSGLPYTPVVGSDVNGDGAANDRAFVFDPAHAPDPLLRDRLGALLTSAPDGARECLAKQLGQAAERNSCRSPWTASMNARVQFAGKFIRTGQRVSVALNLANPLAGVDRLVNGSDGLRGWGGAAAPDPVLYQVRGFDAATRSFQYHVNPRFGQPRNGRIGVTEPFRVTLDVAIDWGASMDIQQLNRFLRPGRGASGGARLTADALKQQYRRNVADVYALIIEESDSLLLTAEQVTALKEAQSRYRSRIDSVWTELAAYSAGLPDRYNAREALLKQEESIDSAWEITRLEGATIKNILSPLQLRMLPQLAATIVNATAKLQIRMYDG